MKANSRSEIVSVLGVNFAENHLQRVINLYRNLTVENGYSIECDLGRPAKELLTSSAHAIDARYLDPIRKDLSYEPLPGKKYELQLFLVCLGDRVLTDTARSVIRFLGLRPATLWHLLLFAEKYPEIQHRFSIAAIYSSIFDLDGCLVPYVGTLNGKRLLGLRNELWHTWHPRTHFLAIGR